MNTIRGSAGHTVDTGFQFSNPDRGIQGQRITGATAVFIRRDDGYVTQTTHTVGQYTDTDGFNAIVIANQKFHSGCLIRSLLKTIPANRKYVCYEL